MSQQSILARHGTDMEGSAKRKLIQTARHNPRTTDPQPYHEVENAVQEVAVPDSAQATSLTKDCSWELIAWTQRKTRVQPADTCWRWQVSTYSRRRNIKQYWMCCIYIFQPWKLPILCSPHVDGYVHHTAETAHVFYSCLMSSCTGTSGG